MEEEEAARLLTSLPAASPWGLRSDSCSLRHRRRRPDGGIAVVSGCSAIRAGGVDLGKTSGDAGLPFHEPFIFLRGVCLLLCELLGLLDDDLERRSIFATTTMSV